MSHGRQASRLWPYVEPCCVSWQGALRGSLTTWSPQRWAHSSPLANSLPRALRSLSHDTTAGSVLHRQVLASLQRQGQRFVSSSPGSPLRHSLRSALKAHGYPPANQLRCFASAGGRKAYSPEQVSSMAQKNRNLGMYMIAVVVGMLGFTYFSVPLYRMFCAATGYGGTVSEGQTVEDKLRKRVENPDIETEKLAAQREVTVSFASEVQPGLNWTFKPCQKRIKVRPGQSTLVFYTASNNSNEDITGVSTYNVTPGQVGFYFNKIQCFCFEEQRLRPGETVDMPIFFYIDPEFVTDRRLHNVDHVTLSYVFFKTGELPTNDDGTPLEPGASMPAHLLPSNQPHKAPAPAVVQPAPVGPPPAVAPAQPDKAPAPAVVQPAPAGIPPAVAPAAQAATA